MNERSGVECVLNSHRCLVYLVFECRTLLCMLAIEHKCECMRMTVSSRPIPYYLAILHTLLATIQLCVVAFHYYWATNLRRQQRRRRRRQQRRKNEETHKHTRRAAQRPTNTTLKYDIFTIVDDFQTDISRGNYCDMTF